MLEKIILVCAFGNALTRFKCFIILRTKQKTHDDKDESSAVLSYSYFSSHYHKCLYEWASTVFVTETTKEYSYKETCSLVVRALVFYAYLIT